MGNYLDTRDLQREFDDLESELNNLKDALEEADDEDREQCQADLAEWEEDNRERFDALRDLLSEVDSRYGVTLIPEDEFENYARDLADDLYGSDARSSSWPFTCIDWEQAADELKQDYSTVEFDGDTYYFRD